MKNSLKHYSKYGTFFKSSIPYIFYTLLLIFLVLYIQNIDFKTLHNLEVDWLLVLVATFFGIITRYWGAYIWLVILKGLGAKKLKNKSELVYIYAKSWLGRYIPGTAPWILGKIYFASRQGISKNKLAVSSMLEGAIQVTVVMVLGFVLLIFDSRLDILDSSLKVVMAIIIVVSIVALIPAIFNRIMATFYKIVRKKQFAKEHYADKEIITKGAGLYVIGAFLNGISFFYISKSIFPDLDFSNMLFLIGAMSLAGAASMLAFFAPSGIGVREGILLVLLSIIMPAEYALVITVFTRLWSIIVDLMFFGLAFVYRKIFSF